MCEILIWFAGAVCAGLLLWIVILDGELDDYKTGVRKANNNARIEALEAALRDLWADSPFQSADEYRPEHRDIIEELEHARKEC
jgi:hypothetical protein